MWERLLFNLNGRDHPLKVGWEDISFAQRLCFGLLACVTLFSSYLLPFGVYYFGFSDKLGKIVKIIGLWHSLFCLIILKNLCFVVLFSSNNIFWTSDLITIAKRNIEKKKSMLQRKLIYSAHYFLFLKG